MISALVSRIIVLIFGTLYPAYASFKAVKSKNVREYVKWMMYWIVFAFYLCVESVADLLVTWIPFYYEMKIIFILWLVSPVSRGARIVYCRFVHPQLSKHEKEIDNYLGWTTDYIYSALISLGARGFSFATNLVLTTAMKGQTKVVDQIRKSYSFEDLSGNPVDYTRTRNDSQCSDITSVPDEVDFDEKTDYGTEKSTSVSPPSSPVEDSNRSVPASRSSWFLRTSYSK